MSTVSVGQPYVCSGLRDIGIALWLEADFQRTRDGDSRARWAHDRASSWIPQLGLTFLPMSPAKDWCSQAVTKYSRKLLREAVAQ